MNATELQTRATDDGVDETQLNVAVVTDDPKVEITKLIVKKMFPEYEEAGTTDQRHGFAATHPFFMPMSQDVNLKRPTLTSRIAPQLLNAWTENSLTEEVARQIHHEWFTTTPQIHEYADSNFKNAHAAILHYYHWYNARRKMIQNCGQENIDSINITLSNEILDEIEDIHLSDPNPCV